MIFDDIYIEELTIEKCNGLISKADYANAVFSGFSNEPRIKSVNTWYNYIGIISKELKNNMINIKKYYLSDVDFKKFVSLKDSNELDFYIENKALELFVPYSDLKEIK